MQLNDMTSGDGGNFIGGNLILFFLLFKLALTNNLANYSTCRRGDIMPVFCNLCTVQIDESQITQTNLNYGSNCIGIS